MNDHNSLVIYYYQEFNYMLKLLQAEDKYKPLTIKEIYKHIRSEFLDTKISSINKLRSIYHAGDIPGRDTRAWCYRHNVNPNVATPVVKDPTKIYCNTVDA